MRTVLMLGAVLGASCGPTPRSQPRVGAHLIFEVRDTASQLIPARITLVGVGGTPDPKLAPSESGELRGRMVVAGNKVMTLEGSGDIDVPPGIYDIYVSRGIEWTLSVTPRVEIGAAGYALQARLDHAVDTTGWLSGDFHVHASPSWDSYVPLENRAAEFVVEGVDLIVSTDHDIVADYAPAIEALRIDDMLASMIGDEITTLHWGHFGTFPLPSSAVGQRYGSAWRHEGTGRDVIGHVRHDHPDALVQVNHPRSHAGMGYFDDERFDRTAGTSKHFGFTLDFDAIEVLNGRGVSPAEAVLLDWFSMLDHGHVVTAMGNSDTHELRLTLGGYPRNYLRVPDDRPGKVSTIDVVRAIRGHHSFFTTGPFVDLRSGDAGIGDIVRARDGKLTVSVTIAAAPWIGVDRAILYVNGAERYRWPIRSSPSVQRFEIEQSIEIDRDSYIVLRADGTEPLWPVAGDAEATQVTPLAITNPLFVDHDGDGRYTR